MFFSIEPRGLFPFETYVCCNVVRKCRKVVVMDTSLFGYHSLFSPLKIMTKVIIELMRNLMSPGEIIPKPVNLAINNRIIIITRKKIPLLRKISRKQKD